MNSDIIPFDETYILYRRDDYIGLLCCLGALCPILILQSYLTWLVIDRDLESVYFTVGQLVNEFINKMLKRWFQMERPLGSGDSHGMPFHNGSLNYGMPSAHSQFMGFHMGYLVVNLYCNGWWSQKYGPTSGMKKGVYSGLVGCLCLFVCWSRWYLEYHHVDQIVIGWQLGLFTSLVYYTLLQVSCLRAAVGGVLSRYRVLTTLCEWCGISAV